MFMKSGKKWIKVLALCLLVAICVPQAVWATEADIAATPEPTPTPLPIETNDVEGWVDGPDVSAWTACLIDANTGTVMYNKGMTDRMNPASTTKVMTALLVLENAELDEVFTFTETGVAEAYSGSSNLITQVGEQFTVEDAIHALMLKSANDFASQIAEYVGGTVENFVQMMNDKAAELGCVNTHFNNAHGMTDENHWSCAYDLCLIMQEACKNQEFCRIAGTLKYVIPATHLTGQRTIETHNGLIMDGENYYEYAIAGKTGYTDAAWCTYVSVAEKDGMKLIEATMKAANSTASFTDAKTLYNYGFDNFQNITLKEANEVYSGGLATVPNGVTADQIVVTQGNPFETILGTMVNETYTYNGHEVGSVAVSMDYIDQVEEEEQARQEAEEAEKLAEEQADYELRQKEAEELQKNLKMIGMIMVVAVVIGILLIIILAIRKALWKRRRRNSKRRKRSGSGEYSGRSSKQIDKKKNDKKKGSRKKNTRSRR